MTWMWLSIIVVLVGAKLNAEVEHRTVRSEDGRARRERHLPGRPLVLISRQPTGEAICERLGFLGEVEYHSKNYYAIILMVVEDRCLVSALVEPYPHRAHLIAKIGPIQKDFHRVHLPNLPSRRNWNTPYVLTSKLNTSSRLVGEGLCCTIQWL